MTKAAIFAAGCFWGVEAAFREVDGVTDVTVGYTGGTIPDPSYKEVCTGRTGHAEAVRVEYDPERVGYEDLLEVFWSVHDPTQVNRQGPDVGTQYRSAIFVVDDAQERAARQSMTGVQERLGEAVATNIEPAGAFYPAEAYHQRYLEKHGRA
jgi:methionine-S-sulfoxide reductase